MAHVGILKVRVIRSYDPSLFSPRDSPGVFIEIVISSNKGVIANIGLVLGCSYLVQGKKDCGFGFGQFSKNRGFSFDPTLEILNEAYAFFLPHL